MWVVLWLGIPRSKFYSWRSRYGKLNAHNGKISRDFWLEEWETKAIIRFYHEHPLEGYRRLTFMMLDADVVAVSPATVWRVQNREGLWVRGSLFRPRRERVFSSGCFPISTGTRRAIPQHLRHVSTIQHIDYRRNKLPEFWWQGAKTLDSTKKS